MRRSVTIAQLALAAVLATGIVAGQSSIAVADDPGPVVDIGTPPVEFARGADAMIRADGARWYEGLLSRSADQRIEQGITQFQHAVSYVRVCSSGVKGRIRVHGTGSTVNWRVRYRVGRHDVTRGVIAGTYRTRWLRSGQCARRIRVVAGLQPGSGTYGRTFRLRAIPASGDRDVVATHVTVVQPIAVP